VTVTQFTTEFSIWKFVIHSILIKDITKQLKSNFPFSDIWWAMVTEYFRNKVDELIFLGHLNSKWNGKHKGYKAKKN
jgi:hypothetical protein